MGKDKEVDMSDEPIQINLVDPESIPCSLLSQARFGKYRRYRFFSDEETLELRRSEYRSGRSWSALVSGRQCAAISCLESEWDSKILEKPYLRILAIDYSEDCPQVALPQLIKAVAAEHLGHEIHVEIDCEDCRLLQLLQLLEFKLLDTKLTYFLTESCPYYKPEQSRYQVRGFQPEDQAALLRIADRQFPTMKARFFSDPDVDETKALQIYRGWLEGALVPDSDYCVRVATRKESPVGFISYKVIEDIERATGRRVFGKGLAAVAAAHSSAYVDLLSQSIQQEFGQAEAAEYETSLQNYGAHRVFEKMGFRLVRSSYSLKLGQRTTASGSASR